MFDDMTYLSVGLSLGFNVISFMLLKRQLLRRFIKTMTILSVTIGFLSFLLLVIIQSNLPWTRYIFYVSIGLWNYGFYQTIILLIIKKKA